MKSIFKQSEIWNTRATSDQHNIATLRELIDKKCIDLNLFFIISLGLCDILMDYYIEGMVNLRINPQNIFVDLENNRVCINNKPFKSINEFNDFGGIESIGRDVMPYISPELSGMMNRSVDYRSDFYSLGTVLYEMLTYKCPFEVSSAFELLYSHTAKLAVSPCEINKNIPVQLSKIVMKLLYKNPEQRYKTSWGIKYDIEKCSTKWKEEGKISKFNLCSKDISDTFEIPEKDYGRKSEIRTILGSYKRIIKGSSELVVVTGENGMGKSWVVERAKQSIVSMGGYFVSGRSNQINLNIPYDSILQALGELIQKILSESKEELEFIRNELMEAMGSNIQVMTDFIPDLKYIAGSKNSLSELTSRESEYRFNMLFQKFIKVFSRRNHPLVIFLDDIQWAHPASLRLITDLIKYYDNKYLLIILGYRGIINTRSKPRNSVELLINDIKYNNTRITKIPLKPLNLEEVTRLLCDSLHRNGEDINELAKILLDKTYGNPLFIDQLMRTLYHRKLINFNYNSITWEMDIKKITKESVPDNVVDMVAQKISMLPADTKKVLRLASCLRSPFDIQTLALVDGSSLAETLNYLNPASEYGIVEVVGGINPPFNNAEAAQVLNNLKFKFVHDCIQQSAYSMIWKDNNVDIHLKVGKLLLGSCNSEEFNQKVFDIVNHLNYATQLIESEKERVKLAGLNLVAGRKAKSANDYETALNYLSAGLKVLPSDKWLKNYGLTTLLTIECAECEYLLGHKDETERLLKDIFKYARNVNEKMQAYIIQVKLYSSYGNHKEAIDIAVKGLKFVEIDIYGSLQQENIIEQAKLIRSGLPSNFEDYVLERPQLKQLDKLYALKLISALSESAYFINRELWKLCMLKIVDMSVKYGNSSVSAVGYVGFGKIIGQSGNLKDGYRLGLLALNLASINEDIYIKTRVFYIFGCYICQWKESYAISLSYLEKAFECAIGLGNFNYAGLIAVAIILVELNVGNNLKDIRERKEHYFNTIKKCKEPMVCYYMCLLNYHIDFYESCDYASIESIYEMLISLEESVLSYKFDAMTALYYSIKIKLLRALGKIAEAMEIILSGRINLVNQYGDISHFSIFYVSAMSIAQFHDTFRQQFNYKHLGFLNQASSMLEKMCALNEENFLHIYLLINAEISRIEGRYWETQILYEKVIDQCTSKNLTMDAALACERAARFFMSQGLDTITSAYANRARSLYKEVGAIWHTKVIDNAFNRIMGKIEIDNNINDHMVSKPEENLANIDVNTAIKVSKIISEEIIMDKLLIKLIDVAMESAGAQKGFLILYDNDKLLIEAEGRISDSNQSKVNKITLEEFSNIAKSVIYYSLRTCEPVILNNATVDPVFSSDSYIIRCKPQSIMCIPIIYNETVLGAIYLENNIAKNVFKTSKLELLSLISSQAAIAIENAQMFRQINSLNYSLENKVEETLEYDKLKTEFFANISHELRTPLNVILTANQMSGVVSNKIEDRALREKVGNYNNLIRQNCYRLIRLTNNLIDITKIDAGYIKISLCNSDIVKSVEDITLSVVEYANRKGIELIFDTDVEEKYLACDLDIIERIMLNLLSNAIKFTEASGSILVSIFDNDDTIRIHVKDSGAGIPEDKKYSIFERFVQVDKSLSRNCEGSGIGLSLVKSLVEMHGGSIEVQSIVGEGSEFIITLPVTLTDNEACATLDITSKEIKVERISIEFSDIYF